MPQKITRYTQRQLEGMKFPQLLLVHDKHRTTHYLLADQAALFLACLAILKQRLDPKYGYIQPPSEEPALRPESNMTDDEVDRLPAHLRQVEQAARQHNAKRRREYEEDVRVYAEASKALQESDGAMAFEILRGRCDYEYEGFELVTPKVP